MTDMSNLAKEIRDVINRHSRESVSNTPDFILATYLEAQLVVFENAVRHRDSWYGIKLA